ncbi:spermatogenesis associated 6-like protein [Kryptolebias marmoratus]|uniref:spermatogenesis associated 6-like protein n=1 Tax=Kryptolebias marmoratus TaxID=37003 RepID=UPI0007F93EDB|nr:spermatogenesis associated 6-like protein [Kryptolebias marmoratus]
MAPRALKVVVDIKFRAVSCPGVRLPTKDDVYLSMCFMGQYSQSECLPAVFPLLVHEKMTFEKIFRYAVDPGDIAVMLEYETVRIELVQLIPPAGDILACFEEDARSFLFPEPKLVPPLSGVDREVLMSKAPHFPGIAPRLEFSTKTSITECSPDAEINIYPNTPMRPAIRRSRRCSSRPPSQKKPPQTHGGRMNRGRPGTAEDPSFRSRSLSPLRHENVQNLSRLSLDSAASCPTHWETRTSLPVLASPPGAARSASPRRSAVPASPLTRSTSSVRHSPAPRRKALSHGLVGGTFEDGSSFLEELPSWSDYHHGPVSSELRQSYREHARHSRSKSISHTAWEEVHERVRGLLTTPKAVRRLIHGATDSEVKDVLARRSISPSLL